MQGIKDASTKQLIKKGLTNPIGIIGTALATKGYEETGGFIAKGLGGCLTKQ